MAADKYRCRVHHLLLGARVLHQLLGKDDDVLAPGTLGGIAQTPQRNDDGLVLLEHRRQIGLEALGKRQHLGHLGRLLAA